MCITGKKCLTKAECISAINRNKRHPKQHKYRKEVRYYHCSKCNMWHLTSDEEREGGTVELKTLAIFINQVMNKP